MVVSAAKANRELDTQTEAFHQMRDLVFNAPERLDALTQQTGDRHRPHRAVGSRSWLQLHTEFDESALASVSRNVNAAKRAARASPTRRSAAAASWRPSRWPARWAN